MRSRLLRCLALFLAHALVLCACSWTPEAKVARHLESGDSYFGEGKFKEAIIEYKNVLQIQKHNIHAIKRVASAHYSLEDFGEAFPYLLQARDLDPGDLDVQLKLATVYLLGGKMDEARSGVELILEKNPKALEALVLSSEMALAPEEIEHAIRRLRAVDQDLGDRPRFHVALGALYMKSMDYVSAEKSFRNALSRDPKSFEAHMALGDMFAAKKDFDSAEKEYKLARDLAPVASQASLKLADFYLLIGKPDRARDVLLETTEKAPDLLPAFYRLAELAISEQRYDECLDILKLVLQKKPSDPQSLLLRGKAKLAKGEAAEAIKDLREVIRLRPRDFQALYQLALAHLKSGDMEEAKSKLREATSIHPGFEEGLLRLSQLEIQSGSFQRAIDLLREVIGKGSRSPQAYLLLGSAFLGNNDAVRAGEAFQQYVKINPGDAQGHFLLGLALRGQSNHGVAAGEFERALELSPSYVDPLAELLKMDFEKKRADDALKRVTAQIILAPDSAGLHHVLGSVYTTRKETEKAEAAFNKAIGMDPNSVTSYLALSQIHLHKKNHAEALGRLDEALEVNPGSLPVLMLRGLVYQDKGDMEKARETYEKVVADYPHYAPAANNLAHLYSEHGGDGGRALELAYKARAEAPDDPVIADTLGWILYKQGKLELALVSLQLSASKLADNPEVQYHLGMAHYKLGNRDAAKKALESALESKPEFEWVMEARRILGEL